MKKAIICVWLFTFTVCLINETYSAIPSDVFRTLLQSPSFVPDRNPPYIDFAGRRFRIGTLESQRIILVMTGLSMDNAGVTTQLTLNLSDIKGGVHFGVLGNANPNLQIGDVTIPKYWARIGLWNWQRYGDGPDDTLALEANNGDYTRDIGYMEFDDYNTGFICLVKPFNLVNRVWFHPEEIFPIDGQPEVRQHALWIPVDENYLAIAQKLKDVVVERCVDLNCLPRPATVVQVERGISASVFVDNQAYREYLYTKFNATPVDMETALVGLIFLQQKAPFIAIRALTDLAGGGGALSNETGLKYNNDMKEGAKELESSEGKFLSDATNPIELYNQKDFVEQVQSDSVNSLEDAPKDYLLLPYQRFFGEPTITPESYTPSTPPPSTHVVSSPQPQPQTQPQPQPYSSPPPAVPPPYPHPSVVAPPTSVPPPPPPHSQPPSLPSPPTQLSAPSPSPSSPPEPPPPTPPSPPPSPPPPSPPPSSLSTSTYTYGSTATSTITSTITSTTTIVLNTTSPITSNITTTLTTSPVIVSASSTIYTIPPTPPLPTPPSTTTSTHGSTATSTITTTITSTTTAASSPITSNTTLTTAPVTISANSTIYGNCSNLSPIKDPLHCNSSSLLSHWRRWFPF